MLVLDSTTRESLTMIFVKSMTSGSSTQNVLRNDVNGRIGIDWIYKTQHSTLPLSLFVHLKRI
jgi:hypothetical protein